MKIRPVEAELCHAVGQTNRHDEANSCFQNLANMPKKVSGNWMPQIFCKLFLDNEVMSPFNRPAKQRPRIWEVKLLVTKDSGVSASTIVAIKSKEDLLSYWKTRINLEDFNTSGSLVKASYSYRDLLLCSNCTLAIICNRKVWIKLSEDFRQTTFYASSHIFAFIYFKHM